MIKHKIVNKISIVIFTLLILSYGGFIGFDFFQKRNDAFINNPFTFKILKNYSDDYSTIGNIVSNTSSCPLLKENIADPSFCFLRTIKYDGLVINMFSFDVLQSGTAEYILEKDTFKLSNGLSVGSTKDEVIKKK